ncbi:hypothetical protein SLEP1_g16073 [Rubroshorea leprosula]|uniref:Uncharacterized protein n=1 Tax=Rubroshorea leprosula TaxID=152421 RepID=A0AAV5IYV4_9ROSI|nr:hypothetical protein SLEP1_g16073 [Rubroshorea leprosula]
MLISLAYYHELWILKGSNMFVDIVLDLHVFGDLKVDMHVLKGSLFGYSYMLYDE